MNIKSIDVRVNILACVLVLNKIYINIEPNDSTLHSECKLTKLLRDTLIGYFYKTVFLLL